MSNDIKIYCTRCFDTGRMFYSPNGKHRGEPCDCKYGIEFKREQEKIISKLKGEYVVMSEYTEKLKSYSDIVLLDELIKRNGIGKAPSVTKRHGEWSEVLIAVGDDETARITFPSNAIDNLRGSDE